jgi:two-component system OmpR family response regulator
MRGSQSCLPRLRVVLVEDSPRLCRLLAGILGELDGVAVVGEAADEPSAIRLLGECQADLAIVDLELGAGSGLEVLRALADEPKRFGHLRTVVFSNYGHPSLRECCRDLGADGFFDKAFQLDDLIEYVLAARRATLTY